jgi:hypothetical protein
MSARWSAALAISTVAICAAAQNPSASQQPLPIFDAHIHYSHDALDVVSASDVIALMKKAGLSAALVSSSNDEGTQRLVALAPDLIVPSLRPYRLRAEISTWVKDPTVLDYLRGRLARYRYAAIGEFHLYGADADLPVPKAMVQLAKQYQLILHAHSDADAVERIFAQDPNALVLWAHAGFAAPAEVAALLKKYPRLWADFAFRSDMAAGQGVDAQWQAVINQFPNRFMVGTDTFTPERLAYIPEHANFSRRWINALPVGLQTGVAFENGHKLIAPTWLGCHPNQAQARVIEHQGIRLAYRFVEPPKVGAQLQLLTSVCAADGSADVVLNGFDATMPDHKHGMNYKPVVQARGTSAAFDTKRIDAVVLHMAGRWQLAFDVTHAGKTIRLTDNLLLR